MSRLTIIGAGGHGKVVADTAEACGYSDICFEDKIWPDRTQHGRWPIVGTPGSGDKGQKFCAIGQNMVREKLFEDLGLSDSPILVHPSATVSSSVTLAAGTLVVAGAVINADTAINHGAILNTGCSIDHDCVLGEFVHISPGARLAGSVRVGARSWIGIGAVVCEGVKIGADVVVAAGAAVIRNIPDGSRVGGVPAHAI